ncbi:MAG: sapC family protein [Micavibrio aeruginosavorus]|uniref:SapC family protein n=1 Tax=Micavibrio aeruginosavorus TaxID=349221 RepID=A0A2W4ZJR7_9BACT|nr:MAG: sapC family protein [Micavibrio aeruginosavorus]
MAQSPSANGQDTKTVMPLFYNNPAPLDAAAHKSLGLKKNFGLGFCKDVNAVPVNLIEMPQVCHFYPIAFSPDATGTPVAIMGLRDNENLFINDKDEWLEETYIPAYVRRYPFIFSEMPESDQLSLCVDMDPSVVDDKSDQKFFDADGKPSILSQNALEFCKSYHAAAQQTIEFGAALAAAGLLVDRQAEIAVRDGKRVNFSGFRIIDESKLADLDEKTFLEWRNKGWLPFIYAHLFSGAQWQRLTQLLNKRMENSKQ